MRSFIHWSMVSSEKSDNFSGPCSKKREGRVFLLAERFDT
jgi:hypothetical protein